MCLVVACARQAACNLIPNPSAYQVHVCADKACASMLCLPVLQCGMARLPSSPSLLVMYASFLIEARKDGQGARTQLQLAQKASPSLLDNYNIYVAQQLSKQLKRGGARVLCSWQIACRCATFLQPCHMPCP